jgi:hypothetical protein
MSKEEENKPPIPSGRVREGFGKKKPTEETGEEKKQGGSGKEYKLIIQAIIDRKEFWIFFSGLLLGYIIGRL